MPASTKAILTNVERMASDDVLLRLWNREAQAKSEDGTERTIGQAWTAFVAAADEAKVADRIPGSVGRTYKKKYADEPAAQPGPKAQRPTSAASRRAPASAGAKAGGRGQRRSKAAPAAEKAAGK